MQRIEIRAVAVAVAGLLVGLLARRFAGHSARIVQACALLVCAAFLTYSAFTAKPFAYLDLIIAAVAAAFGVVELRKRPQPERHAETL
jgi:hypothetical protein